MLRHGRDVHPTWVKSSGNVTLRSLVITSTKYEEYLESF